MNQRGDTLIEVIFATAILALIIVLALGIMNGGTGQAERAVEGTFVRQSIDSQTELLRFARDSYVDGTTDGTTLWNSIKSQRTSSVPTFDSLASSNCTPSGGGAFWLKATGTTVTVQTNFQAPTTFAGPGQGLWIQATPNGSANYIDFYLYACWDSPVGTTNATTGTIVRLYAP